MTTICCIGCNKIFKYMGSFENHIKKKKCPGIYIKILPNEYLKNPKEINQKFEEQFNNMLNDNIEKNKYGCEKCGSLCKSINYLYQHRKKFCKANVVIVYDDEPKVSKRNKNKEYDDYCHDKPFKNYDEITPEMFNDIFNTKAEIKPIKTEIPVNKKECKMINNQNTNISNNNNNNHNNYGVNGDVIINNNNIVIKNYNDDNDEDIINSIPKKIKKNLIKAPDTAIQNLYKLIHIDTPEYRNIYIGHPKNGYGMVMQDGNWKPIKMKELMNDIIIKNSDRLYDIANDDKISVKNLYKTKLEKMLDVISDNGQFTSGIRQDIKLLTYNSKKIIKNNYNRSNNKKQNMLEQIL